MDSELDFSGASISEIVPGEHDGALKRYPKAPSIQLPNQDAEYVSHIAIDIGGSLVKLVYFSPSDPSEQGSADGTHRGGKLHFVNFETSHVEDAIDFIEAKGLHRHCSRNGTKEMRVKATGGGAYKYGELFKERLGVVLDQEDEMACLVSGCNFLLRAIQHEAFTYAQGVASFVPTREESDLYPYLLVNIGSGVSMVKVTGDNAYERVSGSSIGGGTFWGLCRLLTGVTDFDEMLEFSKQGDNAAVDMLVGDIYGGRDYTSIGLSATTIASSFGKVVSSEKALCEYNKADICVALCRMVAYNIGQLAHLNATRHGIKRILFGGFFIRGHPYTMETISYAINFWSKGEMAAMFLRHEGFLGAMGAFLKVHPMDGMLRGGRGSSGATGAQQPGKVRARFVERFSMGAPLTGGAVVGPAIRDVSEKVSWVEKFVAASSSAASAVEQAAAEAAGDFAPGVGAGAAAGEQQPPGASHAPGEVEVGPGDASGVIADGTASGSLGAAKGGGTARGGWGRPGITSRLQHPAASSLSTSAVAGGGPAGGGPGGAIARSMSLYEPPPLPSPSGHGPTLAAARQRLGRQLSLHVGVLHFSPTLEPFPLLADPASYEPNTLDINSDEEELRWWLDILRQQIPTVVEKACASEGGGEAARRRAVAFGSAFGAHLDTMQAEPGSYGALGLAELFEMREECLREFNFTDVYRLEKQRENAAALAVLPDLLREVDAQPLPGRLLALVEGVLAANIFDWGSQACVALYKTGAILDIYRDARLRLQQRPWALDGFDAFSARIMAAAGADPPRPPYRRVMMFVDNSGADIVLGMLPFAREFLRLGCEVVLVANSLPAINDITAAELRALLATASDMCPVISAAREAALRTERATGGHVPPYPGLLPARRSSANLLALSPNGGNGSPPKAHTTYTIQTATPQSPSPFHPPPSLSSPTLPNRPQPPASSPSPSQQWAPPASSSSPVQQTQLQQHHPYNLQQSSHLNLQAQAAAAPSWHAVATDPSVNRLGPKLYVVGNGAGGPCLDLRRVPDKLAEACVGVDLLVIEGMGRAIHTNLNATFKCDVLKLAMIKTERLARKLFSGNLYDCVCVFDTAEEGAGPGAGGQAVAGLASAGEGPAGAGAGIGAGADEKSAAGVGTAAAVPGQEGAAEAKGGEASGVSEGTGG